MKIRQALFFIFFALSITSCFILKAQILPVIDKSQESDPSSLVGGYGVMGNQLFFIAQNSKGSGLWTSDGTNSGTFNLINKGYSNAYVGLNSTLFFTSYNYDINGFEIWATNGTTESTRLVKDTYSGGGKLDPSTMTSIGTSILFATGDGSLKRSLWRTDGSDSGTIKIREFEILPYKPSERFSTNLFFEAKGDTLGRELWKSDGTESGTVMVKDIVPGSGSSYPYELRNVNGELFFFAYNGSTGYDLWKCDGTETGTQIVKEFSSIDPSIVCYWSTGSGGLYYFGIYRQGNYELWRSDGTTSGTFYLKNVAVQPNHDYATPELNGKIYFSGNDGVSGSELWVSDGTSDGTRLVIDLVEGENSSYPYQIAVVKNLIYFNISNSDLVYSFWASDGTSLNTMPIYGSDTISVAYFIPTDNKIFIDGFRKTNSGNDHQLFYYNSGTQKLCTYKPIQFEIPSPIKYGDKSFKLLASSSVDLPITFNVIYPNKSIIRNDTISIRQAGNLEVIATQIADSTYCSSKRKSQVVVEKTLLTVKPDSVFKKYGDLNPELTLSYSGFVAGDNINDIQNTPIAYTIATEISTPGIYPIYAYGGFDLNYDFQFDSGVLVIQKGLLAVHADNKTKIYGDINPTLTISYTGFVGTDSVADLQTVPVASTSAVEKSPAGTYDIIVTGGTAENYNLVFVNGVLTIEKATLTAWVNNTTRKYNESNPTFTINYSGFIEPDSIESIDVLPSVSTLATSESPVGLYDIQLAGGSAKNYNFKFEIGVLTIEKASQEIHFELISSIAFSETPFILSATATSGLPVKFSSSSEHVTLSDSLLTMIRPGNVVVFANQSGNTNYEAAEQVYQTFCVNPPTPLITYNENSLLLSSNSQTGNQWFLNNVILIDENNSSIKVSQSGSYTVRTTIEGCNSPVSAPYVLVVTSIQSEQENSIKIYPCPVTTELIVEQSLDQPKSLEITIYNMSGKQLKTIVSDSQFQQINFSSFSMGIYMIAIGDGDTIKKFKVLKID